MYVTSVRHDWPEKAGFIISRPKGLKVYTFLHFLNPMYITVNGKEIYAKSGACIFFSPNTAQLFHSEVNVVHNWAHFSPEFEAKLAEYNIPTDTILFPQDTSFISTLFRILEQEYFSDYSHREKICDSVTEEFLIRFSRSLSGELPQSLINRFDRLRFSELRHQILSFPERKLSIPQIAEMLNLSPSRFHALYKAMFGTSPMQDIIEARINRAKTLLISDGESSISQLAELLGYNDQYHFIRQFKAVTGETPAAFRKCRR